MGVAASSSSAAASSPLVAGALALGFLAGVPPVAALLTDAPPRSFFLMVRKQVLAEAAVL